MDSGSRGGIEVLENSVEISGAALLRPVAQTGAQFLGTLRAGKKARFTVLRKGTTHKFIVTAGEGL